MNRPQKVLIGLSGGVDSAVAAHLLIQQGYEVIAGFMKNYAEPDNPYCTTRQDRDMAIKVAEHLGIKTFIIFDFRQEYQEKIIDYIYKGYLKGLTPNPDVFCNNLIKFDLFLKQALSLGCDAIATGHYAQIIKIQGHKTLYRGVDPIKDQSYFLARLNQHQIDHAILPLGSYTKSQIRTLAHEINLPNADRPDSQGLCFIGNVPMAEFLRKKLPEQQGNIIKADGTIVGTHQGAWFYTLGQRHQLFLPFKAYVTHIDVTTNTLTVGDKEDERLLTDTVTVTDWHWTGREKDQSIIEHCLIKIRYRQEPAIEARLVSFGREAITFHIPQTRGVTPGQILVAYNTERQVIGSGIITQ